MRQHYKLIVRVTVHQVDELGRWTGQGLEVSEEVSVEASSFLEIATLLGRFHELTEKMKAERGVCDAGSP